MKAFDEIFAIAEGNFGLVTYAEAKSCGVAIRELDRWVKSGRLEKVARGVYRVAKFPVSEYDSFAAATETIGSDAYLYGESVIAMLRLVPTNPTWIYVASPKRVRRTVSEALKIVRGEYGYAFTNYEGVRSQHLADAIRASRGNVRPDRRIRATQEGLRQGYLTKSEAAKLIKEIKHDAAS